MKNQALQLIKICFCLFFCLPVDAQRRLPPTVKALVEQMQLIPAGTFVMGENGGMLNTKEDLEENEQLKISPQKISLNSFYMAQFELTTQEWRVFYLAKKAELGTELANQYLPDTLIWQKQFPEVYNAPLVNNYFWHPTFRQYPVVGVTWNQVQAYCEWKTLQINHLLKPYNLQIPPLRLPTEAEWEYAAYIKKQADKDLVKQHLFPWNGEIFIEKPTRKKKIYKANFGSIQDDKGLIIKSLSDDGYVYTSPVKTYLPNDMQIYQMGGNVSEWVADLYRSIGQTKSDSSAKNSTEHQMAEAKNINYVYKGASFMDSPIYSLSGARRGLNADMASATIGFRIVINRSGSEDVIQRLKKMR